MVELESLRQSAGEVTALQARIAAFESGMVMMKMTAKPCLLFKGVGISGFAMALAQLSSGQISRNGEATELLRKTVEK